MPAYLPYVFGYLNHNTFLGYLALQILDSGLDSWAAIFAICVEPYKIPKQKISVIYPVVCLNVLVVVFYVCFVVVASSAEHVIVGHYLIYSRCKSFAHITQVYCA